MLRINDRIVIPRDEIEISAVRAQGAGGQNVNKVASAVHLKFDVRASRALPEDCKARLLARRDRRIADGVVVIKAQQHRSLARNKEAALERLRALIESALVTRRPRKPTAPPAAARRRRLEEKARRAALKRSRAPVRDA